MTNIHADRILILEDTLLIAMFVQAVVEDFGLAAMGPARNVAEALALIAEATPDAAILDINLSAAFHGIGIRIEDDIAVRAGGQPCEVLTAAAPKTVADIEAVMR